MEKVKLNAIFFNKTDKQGNDLVSKKGRPYTMVQINYGEDLRASMYCDNEWNKKELDEMRGWTSGDEKTLIFTQNGDFNNFSLPKDTDLLDQRITDLEVRVNKIVEVLKSLKK